MDTLVQDAKDFGKHLNSVPVGDVPADANTDDISAISFQSTRSIKDKIRIVQNPEDGSDKNGFASKMKSLVEENIVLNKFQQALENLQVSTQKNWEGIQQNTYKTFENINTSTKEMVDEKIKPGWDNTVNFTKDIPQNTGKFVDEKIKPGWENTVTFTKEIPANTGKFVDEKVKPGWDNTVNFTKEIPANTGKFVDEKVKPGWDNTVAFTKEIPANTGKFVDEKIKPGWDNTVAFTKELPGQSVAVVTKVRDVSVEQYKSHISPKLQFVREFHDTYSEYYMGTAPLAFSKADMSLFKYKLAQGSLLSIGAIMNCDNPVSGAFIWLAILVAYPMVALGGLSSLVVAMSMSILGLSTTHDLKWTTRAGANAFLAGAMVTALVDYPSNFFVDFFWQLVSASSLGIYCLGVHFLLFSPTPTSSIPPLLWSYNIVVGIAALDFVLSDRATLTALAPDAEALSGSYSILSSSFSGVSAIFGVTQPWCGVFILIGVSLCSRILALSLLGSSCVAGLLGWGFGMAAVDVNAGMAGCQAALVAVTCAYYFVPSKPLVVLTGFAILGTCILQSAIATIFIAIM